MSILEDNFSNMYTSGWYIYANRATCQTCLRRTAVNITFPVYYIPFIFFSDLLEDVEAHQ